MPTLIMPTIVQQPPCLQSTHSAPSAAVPGWRAPARRQCGYQVDKKCHLLLMRVGLIWPAVISTNFFCETATPISGENRSLTEEVCRDHSGPDQADPHQQKVTLFVNL